MSFASRCRCRPTLELLEDRRLPATFVVTNTNDQGPGSFREAIRESDATPGQTNEIDFNIPGNGEHSFRPHSHLPPITTPVVIDGTTQPDYKGSPVIVLVGTYAHDIPEVHGLDIQAGYTTIKGMVVNGFTGSGILIEDVGYDVIQNCYIGTDLTGTIAYFNNKGGVLTSLGADHNLIGGTSPEDRNVISGNNGHGIDLYSSFNVVQGNYLGLQANGHFPLPNSKLGILIGNVFGETQGNIVGGTEPGAANVISANQQGGIELDIGTHDNVIQGNLIGTDPTGTLKRGNRETGIVVKAGAVDNLIGGTDPGAGNLISGNGSDAIVLNDQGNVVQGNVIGLDITGSSPIPNGGDGVKVLASNNLIGGTDPGAGNTIAYNGGDGVYVAGGNGNAIQQNAIYGQAGLGIHLAPNGNNAEPAPTLTSATTDGSTTTITGSLDSLPDTTFTVEVFANTDDGGNPQGAQYLGSLDVNTDGNGAADFSLTLDSALDAGTVITATATDTDQNTSEFADYVTVTSSGPLRGAGSNPASVGAVSPAGITLERLPVHQPALDQYFATVTRQAPANGLTWVSPHLEQGGNGPDNGFDALTGPLRS